MTRYAFELSGEHGTLPRSEALALLHIYSSGYREIQSLDQCLVVEAEDMNAPALGRRLAMSHRVIEVLAISSADLESIAAAADGMPIPDGRYRVRGHRVKFAPLSSGDVEKAVGAALFRRGQRADLKNPDVDLRAIITGEGVVIGREVARADRGGFEGRRPHLKPFFHPGVLMPRVARALVNISQVREGEILLDPFAGTGGILVEACLIGVRGVGLDVQKKLIRGARANMEGLICDLLVGDARRLPFRDESIDSAVLDTPYGRSAVIRANSREELLKTSLSELHRVLKTGRRMAVVADRPINSPISDAGFEIVETHYDRVHGSLTRQIFICRA